MKKWAVIFVAAIIVLMCVAACGENELLPAPAQANSYYISGTRAEKEKLANYFFLLENDVKDSREQFAVVREIANTFVVQKEYGKLINFLGARVHQHPEDPYTSYYLFMIAFAYQEQEANPIAALYFDMIVKNYPDLVVLGNSIHLTCLTRLITLTDDPQQKEWYYEELISRFLDQIEPGPAYFMLAQAYENTGEWHSAIEAYTRYLSYLGSIVPGFPDADNYARRTVDFSNSAKDWTSENLTTLVDAVKAALDTASPARVSRYQAKVNFFAKTWEQKDSNDEETTDFNIGDFMRGGRVRYAENLDISSNANEAYLRTWGWGQYISIWYLYFRKIYFPSDPEIHGRWEWAGVYYGEKF